MRLFQIIFNPTSAAELSRMPKDLQLDILGEFRGLPQEVMSTELERFGKLERAGKTMHRFRIGDYRIYFERHELGVVVHRILSKNTLKDFLFRSSLPMGEDEALQENPKFWDLIETARTSAPFPFEPPSTRLSVNLAHVPDSRFRQPFRHMRALR